MNMQPEVLIYGILYMSLRVVISPELKFILTGLRFFVQEKYLRPHKAPRVCPKHSNLSNIIYHHEMPINRHIHGMS